jgi:hypothetical protein
MYGIGIEIKTIPIYFSKPRPRFILKVNNYPTLVSKVMFYIYILNIPFVQV